MALSIPTANEIRDKFEYRWPRMCIDQRFWSLRKRINCNPLANWQEVKFERANFNALDHLVDQQGIYIFVAKPPVKAIVDHSYIVYVGETKNISQRFKTYFSYARSSQPSDQMRRRMVIVWADCLYFNYYLTQGWKKSRRTGFENYLIDSIAPPLNTEIRSRLLVNYKKALTF